MGNSTLKAAINLAVDAHNGQYRKYSGDPYIVHPFRVMLALAGESTEVRCAAVLHDVVEDTSVTLHGIRVQFGEQIAQLVDAVSRRKDETYAEFIDRSIAAGPDAVKIKIADIRDNMADGPEGHAGRKPGRYQKALAKLLESQLVDA